MKTKPHGAATMRNALHILMAMVLLLATSVGGTTLQLVHCAHSGRTTLGLVRVGGDDCTERECQATADCMTVIRLQLSAPTAVQPATTPLPAAQPLLATLPTGWTEALRPAVTATVQHAPRPPRGDPPRDYLRRLRILLI